MSPRRRDAGEQLMAQNMFRRAMAYLGLVDEEYDDLDRNGDARPYRAKPEPAPVASSRYDEPDEYEPPVTKVTPMQPRRGISVIDSGTRPQVRPMGSGAAPGSVRVVPSEADVQIVQPTSFNEGKEIADALKANRPVIVNVESSGPELHRRILDFCSGLVYMANGSMSRVTDRVFLLSPANVKVSEETRQRLHERGYRADGGS
ncbi:MAG TPA: cell division protein SepF [Acidimicrobiales bacterium]|jgi:cell division inhibitor SepF|nr:cell division protein SepF [Acidimicrobiales bacterium]